MVSNELPRAGPACITKPRIDVVHHKSDGHTSSGGRLEATKDRTAPPLPLLPGGWRALRTAAHTEQKCSRLVAVASAAVRLRSIRHHLSTVAGSCRHACLDPDY